VLQWVFPGFHAEAGLKYTRYHYHLSERINELFERQVCYRSSGDAYKSIKS